VSEADFAVRFGFRPPPVDLASDQMPISLRNGLWDVTCAYFFGETRSLSGGGYSTHFDKTTKNLWFSFYREPADERPRAPSQALQVIRTRFFAYEFADVYRFLEFIASTGSPGAHGTRKGYAQACNLILARERAAFRFAELTLVQISSEEQVQEVALAIQSDAKNVSQHIRRAAELYSAQEPDYRNSIKEAISAVEASVSIISGDKPDGVSRSLQRVLDEHILHPSLRQGFVKLYAFTSDAGGIRHALLEDGREVSQDDARYMLVSCSAFSNYLMALAAQR
jgi:hypothetical protein